MIEKIQHFSKGCGKGRIVAICQTKDVVSFLKNPIRTYCLYNYYRYLSEYCQYDKVWIMSNVPSTDPKQHICKNMLKNCNIIWGTSEHHLLEKYNVNDVIMQCTPPNFYGGALWVFAPYNINRITEWWMSSNGTDNKLFYIQDDPLFPDPNIPQMVTTRLLDRGNLTLAYNKVYPKEVVEPEVEYMKSIRGDIDECFKHVIIGFCGIDYNKFLDNVKGNKPEVIAWDNFNCYIWNGVNDNLDVKLKTYSWEDKPYDSEYHGVTKSSKRTKTTEDYYSALTNKFLHITGRSDFFKKLKNGVNFDKYDVMEYYDLWQFVASRSKSAFITHEENILGNQISPRYFDCMLADIIAFCDLRYDPEKKLTDDEVLKDFMYVSSPKEFAEKVDKIANDKEFYMNIKYRQRKSILDKFEEYITEENKIKYVQCLKNMEAGITDKAEFKHKECIYRTNELF